MSETFYIKKTAFDDNITDLAQRELDSFIIGPGELNGPAGREQDSDLELYGFGAIKWGEGVNQNQYRLMESNACPAKETGDFKPGTDDEDGFVAGTGSYVAGVDALLPKDQRDLGIGNGITAPLIGQVWYNTTDNILYNFELSGWETVFKEVTDALAAHAADDSLHITAAQNTFLDGLNLPALTSAEVNTLNGISLSLGGGTVQGQLDLMVEKAGDTMTGDLIMASQRDIQFESGHHRITNNDGGGNFNIRVGNEYDGGTVYTQTGGAIHIVANHESTNPKITFNIGDGNGTGNTVGAAVSFSGVISFNQDGTITSNAGTGDITANSDLTTKGFTDLTYVNVAGDVMSSNADLSFVGGGEVLGLPTTPSGTTAASSKAYTDTKAPINSPTLTGDPRSVTFSSTDNSTRIATTAFVQAASMSKAEVSAMIRTYDEANLFGAGGWSQFISAINPCTSDGMFNFHDSLGSSSMGLATRSVWHDLYGVDVRIVYNSYSSGDDYYWTRDSAYTPLAQITNYTSATITWQCQVRMWYGTDDTGYARVLENGVNIHQQGPYTKHARCLAYNKTTARGAWITLSRNIPAGQTYTYKLQGYCTGGYAVGGTTGGDVVMPSEVNYNRIVF